MTASREIATTEQLSTRRELELLRDLQRLAGERAREEERIRTVLADGLQAAEQARDTVSAEIEREFNAGRSVATTEYENVTGQARQRYETDRNVAQKEYKGLRHGVESELSRVKEAARNEKQQASWEALTVFDALKGQPRERFLATVKRLEHNSQELAVLEHDAIEIMQMRRQWREFPAVEASRDGEQLASDNGSQRADAVEQAIQRANDLTTAVREAALALHDQKLPRLFEGGWPFGVFLLLWIVARFHAQSSWDQQIGFGLPPASGSQSRRQPDCTCGSGRSPADRVADSSSRFSSCWLTPGAVCGLRWKRLASGGSAKHRRS